MWRAALGVPGSSPRPRPAQKRHTGPGPGPTRGRKGCARQQTAGGGAYLNLAQRIPARHAVTWDTDGEGGEGNGLHWRQANLNAKNIGVANGRHMNGNLTITAKDEAHVPGAVVVPLAVGGRHKVYLCHAPAPAPLLQDPSPPQGPIPSPGTPHLPSLGIHDDDCLLVVCWWLVVIGY